MFGVVRIRFLRVGRSFKTAFHEQRKKKNTESQVQESIEKPNAKRSFKL